MMCETIRRLNHHLHQKDDYDDDDVDVRIENNFFETHQCLMIHVSDHFFGR